MHFHSNYNYVSVHQNRKAIKNVYSMIYAHPKQQKRNPISHWLIFCSLFFFYLCLCSLYVVGWRIAGVYIHSGLLVSHSKLCTKGQTKIKSWIGEKTNPEWYQSKPKNDTLRSKHTIFSSIKKGKVTPLRVGGRKGHC